MVIHLGKNYRIHCCLLDRECRSDYREYGMPLRLYLHREEPRRSWQITFLSGDKIRERVWNRSTPVKINE